MFPAVNVSPNQQFQGAHVPAAGAAASIVFAALPNAQRIITNIQWSYGAAPAAGAIVSVTGSVSGLIWSMEVPAAGPGGYNCFIKSPVQNESLTVALSAGGGAVQSRLAAQGFAY